MGLNLVLFTGGILVREHIAGIIFNAVALGLILTAAFIVSPYTGFAAVFVIPLLFVKK